MQFPLMYLKNKVYLGVKNKAGFLTLLQHSSHVYVVNQNKRKINKFNKSQ